MNKVILMGRLTRDPEVRYSQSANPIAVTRYGLAVRRAFPRPNEPDVDFFNVVAFGSKGEFAGKYFKKGQMVSIVGSIRVNNWEDAQSVKHTSVEVIADEQYFAESKSSYESRNEQSQGQSHGQNSDPGYTFTPTSYDDDGDLPF